MKRGSPASPHGGSSHRLPTWLAGDAAHTCQEPSSPGSPRENIGLSRLLSAGCASLIIRVTTAAPNPLIRIITEMWKRINLIIITWGEGAKRKKKGMGKLVLEPANVLISSSLRLWNCAADPVFGAEWHQSDAGLGRSDSRSDRLQRGWWLAAI